VAAELHADQKRKKDDRTIPYVSHLLATAAMVIEDGGDEDQAIAALLHDAMEDRGLTEERLLVQFGAEVARIVVACSDTTGGGPKPPWRPRKEAHLRRLRGADQAVLRVTAADKLHNCRDVVADVSESGPSCLERFRGGVEGTCWYYREVASILAAGLPASRLTAELATAVRRLHELVGFEQTPGGSE
jgi:(p)ppGpp synthase/HD superfamily hydrolase